MKRLRVLLSAFAFAPTGSEAGVGWNVATRLARQHDVTVLCGDIAGDRPTETQLSKYFENNPNIPGLTICYVEPTRTMEELVRLHGKPGLWSLYYAAYTAWQKKAFTVAAHLHSDKPFDIAHQLTYMTYREPGYLWRLPLAFLWGPIGGAADVPLNFARILGVGGTIAYSSRRVANAVQRRASFRAKKAARKAKLVWVSTDAERLMVQRWGGHAELERETGTNVLGIPRHRQKGNALQIAWSGLHVPRKAMQIALEAVARLKGRADVMLHVLGSGPDTEAYRRTAARLGINERVVWHGRLAHQDALRLTAKMDVFLHSALLEGTPTVVLEALSFGLPVVCHDACGMSYAITDECGRRIPLRNPEISVSGFAHAIEQLANDSQLYNRLAFGALERAQELSWDRKVERFSEAYLNAVSEI